MGRKHKLYRVKSSASLVCSLLMGHASTVDLAGSFERMMALLTEQYWGRWPLHLSPRQVGNRPLLTAARLDSKDTLF